MDEKSAGQTIKTMSQEPHIHTYDEQGNITCCTLEEKINAKAPSVLISRKEKHTANDGHDIVIMDTTMTTTIIMTTDGIPMS